MCKGAVVAGVLSCLLVAGAAAQDTALKMLSTEWKAPHPDAEDRFQIRLEFESRLVPGFRTDGISPLTDQLVLSRSKPRPTRSAASPWIRPSALTRLSE